MKKIFSFLAIAAIVASCAKTEPVYTEDNSEIRLAPVTSVATKANYFGAIDNVYYPKAENFDVYAYWINDEGKKSADYLTGEGSGVEFVNKGAYWGGQTTYYWPKNGSLQFAAYSPSSLNVAHDYEKDTYTVAYEQSNEPANTVDFLVAPTTTSYTAQTAAEKVAVVFEHALSWITLKVKSTEEAAAAFTINKVEINAVGTKASFTGAMDEEELAKRFVWTKPEAPLAYKVFEGNYTVNTTATVIDAVANGTVVIPQAPTTVTVYYTQNALAGTPALENQKVTVSLALSEKVLEQDENTEANKGNWEPGKHYTYTLVFDLDEILINPTVEDWTDVDAGEVSTDGDAQTVSNADELKKALENGGTVVLKNDIEVTESLSVTKTTVLDLNGKTLKTSTANYGVTNKAELTIKNGTIEGTNPVAPVCNYAETKTYDVDLVLEDVVVTSTGTHAIITWSKDYVTVPYDVHDLAPTSLTINGGSVSCTSTVAGSYAVKAQGFCDVAIADATINGSYGGVSIESSDCGMTNTTVTGGTYALHVYCGEVWFDETCSVGESRYYQIYSETDSSISYDLYVNGVCYSAAAAELAAAVAKGGEVALTKDVVLSETLVVPAGKEVVLDLAGQSLVNQKENESTDVIVVEAGATLTIKGAGSVEAVSGNDGYAVIADGTVKIEGGSFKSGFDANGLANACVYARGNGKVYVSGGDFTSEGKFTLNKKDADRATTVIEVSGGTFYKWNPANNEAEGAGTSFLAEGYKVVAAGNVYTVVAE